MKKNDRDGVAGFMFRLIDRERIGAMGKRRGSAAFTRRIDALAGSSRVVGCSGKRGTDGGKMCPVLGGSWSGSSSLGTHCQDIGFLERKI